MGPLQKIIDAINTSDYSNLTLADLFYLVDRKLLRPATAARIALQAAYYEH